MNAALEMESTMKRKINTYLITLATVAIILSVILSNIISYFSLRDEVFSDLKACVHAIEGAGAFDDPKNITYRHTTDIFRITLIDATGKVWYDSNADVTKLDSHYNREEVKEARASGEGQSIRHSDTLQKDTYYYAILLENGCVLRMAREASSILNIFLSSVGYLFGMILLLIILSVICSRFLARSIIAPIEQMAQNIKRIDSQRVYKEMRPFVDMIRSQHENIIKNADMRQEFSANVSHELKTPLTAISGYAEIMENGMASQEDMIRFSREIHKNANRLLVLINDTIRLSELDVTEEECATECFDMYQLAKSCVELLQVKADKLGITVSLEGEASLVNLNREMMDELLYNLCDNAIRYNNRGGKVMVRLGKEEEGNQYLEVEDTGIGIPKEHQERIFERFYRVDKSRSKETGGTGLGLAIVKHIVAQMQAVLSLESEVGKGTLIRVTFPLDVTNYHNVQKSSTGKRRI